MIATQNVKIHTVESQNNIVHEITRCKLDSNNQRLVSVFIVRPKKKKGTSSLVTLVPPEMTTERAALRETFLADVALVGLLAGVSPPMLDQVAPGAVSLAAELADLRLVAGVYPQVNLHILPRDQLAAHLAGHLALAGVSPHVLLVAVAVERLEAADLALELLPRPGLAVQLHVAAQISAVAEGLVADLAGARFRVGVHAHVEAQGGLQVEALVADLAELREFFVVPSEVDVQAILRRELRAAYVTDVRRVVEHLVHLEVSPLFEHLLALVAFDGLRLVDVVVVQLPVSFDRVLALFLEILARHPAMLHQLYPP